MELKQCSKTCIRASVRVLIVPYGIETRIGSLYERINSVLIVPYGIETHPVALQLPPATEC